MGSGLNDYLRLLSKRRWVVAASLLATLAGAVAATLMMSPTYQANSQLFVGQRQVAQANVAQGQEVAQLSSQLLKSYARIIATQPIATRAIREGQLPLRPNELARDIRADPVLDTQIIRLSYSSPNASLAAATVNAMSRAFVSEIQTIELPVKGDSRPAIQVSVVEPAQVPTSPVSPNPIRNIGLAIVLGSLLGIGLAFVVEQLDTTIKNKRDMRDEHLPVLVEIPRAKSKGVAVQDADGPIGEAFRRLRSTIQFNDVDETVRSILVTSPEPTEGKSTVALNLAIAYAESRTPTVLVEADLRNPVLHTIFKLEGKPGLAHFLAGMNSLDEITVRTLLPYLEVIPAGAIPSNPSELLSSERMRWSIERLRDSHPVVIVDSAPLLPVADSIALCTRVDGVLIVVRGQRTKRRPLEESVEAVQHVGGKLIGVVLNAVKPEPGSSGYYPYPYVRRRTTA